LNESNVLGRMTRIQLSLLYRTTAFQAADNPKGAILYPTKVLHDDGNSCIIPSMWQSVVGHDLLDLVFVGKEMKIEVHASHQCFYWFMGWIPHKTELNI
jgi:hypothetical protein